MDNTRGTAMRWFWNAYARFYGALKTLLPYRELIHDSVKELTINEPGLRILDAGCGPGHLTDAIKANTIQPLSIEGVDASPAMLKQAEEKETHGGFTQYKKHDLNNPLPYPDGSFDRLACINVLYAMRDPSGTLLELARVLRFGGILVLANPKSTPRIRDVLYAHAAMLWKLQGEEFKKELRATLSMSLSLAMIILMNIVIKHLARKRSFFFVNEKELIDMLTRNGFHVIRSKEAYGGTDVFITATKVLRMKDRKGDETTIEIAHTEEDLRSMYQLRYRVYCEEMRSLDPAQYPDREERDRCDPHAIHLVTKQSYGIVGTLRLIKDNPQGFLMEDEFELPPNIDRSKTVEHSRGIIERNCQGRGIYDLLLAGAYTWQREHGYPIGIGAPNITKLYGILSTRGWVPIGERTEYHNTTVVPMMIRLDGI